MHLPRFSSRSSTHYAWLIDHTHLDSFSLVLVLTDQLLVLGFISLVLAENDQAFKDRLVREKLVGTEFGPFASSDSDRSLMCLELIENQHNHFSAAAPQDGGSGSTSVDLRKDLHQRYPFVYRPDRQC